MSRTDTITHAEQRRALYRTLADSDLPAPASVVVNVTDGEQHGNIRLADDEPDSVAEWAMAHGGSQPEYGQPIRPARRERDPFRPFRTYSTNVTIAGIDLRVSTYVHDVPGGAR